MEERSYKCKLRKHRIFYNCAEIGTDKLSSADTRLNYGTKGTLLWTLNRSICVLLMGYLPLCGQVTSYVTVHALLLKCLVQVSSKILSSFT
jgi:hypothetical protein